MAVDINYHHQDGMLITGSRHVCKLIWGSIARINGNKFHIIPFNLAGLVEADFSETERNDKLNQFGLDPQNAIQINDKGMSSPKPFLSEINQVVAKSDSLSGLPVSTSMYASTSAIPQSVSHPKPLSITPAFRKATNTRRKTRSSEIQFDGPTLNTRSHKMMVTISKSKKL